MCCIQSTLSAKSPDLETQLCTLESSVVSDLTESVQRLKAMNINWWFVLYLNKLHKT